MTGVEQYDTPNQHSELQGLWGDAEDPHQAAQSYLRPEQLGRVQRGARLQLTVAKEWW